MIRRKPYAHLAALLSRRSLLQWSFAGLLSQVIPAETPTPQDPGVSLLNHIKVDINALDSAFFAMYVPLDEEAPRREPYPIMWHSAVAITFKSFETIDDTLFGSYDAYPSWLAEQYDGKNVWEGDEPGMHLRDSTDSFGLSHWTWNVRDEDEVSGYPDLFVAALVAQAQDALVFNWAASYGTYPIPNLTNIMESAMNHWGVGGLGGLVPDFADFPDPMAGVSYGPVTELLIEANT